MRFFLGTHIPHWLNVLKIPLFVSRRTLEKYRNPPVAKCPWVLDSGGFTELSIYGKWTVSPRKYVEEVRRYSERSGNLQWASPQDWMCEPWILKRTGLTVLDHQLNTVVNLMELRDLAPELPIIPVLQGWVLSDYLRHIEIYQAGKIDLLKEPLVGLGSICRRQHTEEAAEIIAALAGLGIKLHGFGLKLNGLEKSKDLLVSADSMAWSRAARWEPSLPECEHEHCNNCIVYAQSWYDKVMEMISGQDRTK